MSSLPIWRAIDQCLEQRSERQANEQDPICGKHGKGRQREELGISRCAKEPMIHKPRPASKAVRVKPLKGIQDAI